jgi:hypothetical protein
MKIFNILNHMEFNDNIAGIHINKLIKNENQYNY